MIYRKLCLGILLFVLVLSLGACASRRITKSYRYYDLAINAFHKNDLIAALEYLNEAQKLAPHDPDVEQMIGLVYFARGDFDGTNTYLNRCEKHFLRAIKLYQSYEVPEYQDYGRLSISDAHVNLSAVYIGMGLWDQAIEHAKKAAEDPYHRTPDRANFNIGWSLYKKGQPLSAIPYLQLSISQNQGFAGGYKSLGEVYLDTKKYNKAVDNLTKAIKIFPDYTEAYYLLGVAYQKQNRRSTAKKIFRKCEKINPEDSFSKKCSDFAG